jgi:hypothetical protein
VTTKFVLLPQACGYGYYSYSPAGHQYGTDSAIAALLDVTQAFSLKHPDVEVGVGDISLASGAKLPPHVSHRNGRDIDIRPFRTDGAHSPVTFRDKEYDRALAQALVDEFLAHKNVDYILFNDGRITGVKAHVGHDNHLHVSMKT